MKNRPHNKNGFALFSVLFLIAVISIMLGMLLQLSGQRVHTAKRLTNQIKALAYAEAGIDYAYSILSVDFDQRDNPDAFLLDDSETQSSYGEGSFALTITPIDGHSGAKLRFYPMIDAKCAFFYFNT